ncbi:uncharacterized protein I303_106558 [Kwoniella dejecticola CBS 10117]|uniref:Uncharacterized protein n=1 Tax=Kwoniella dejecticola CBS 10117 TaxID=1296121 RepID=A0A1A5ZUD7_9TREE|nr:uncharacterized protein I303_08185 [Kwoniella dejecticola CBS 10117]OBR81415.1 hypothetical protein I303_08185 [Kwoniella dejecticola CBS 10117]
MPSAISLSSSIIPDFKDLRSKTKSPSFSLPKSPKAAKRFFGFPSSDDSPPVPPLPSASHHHHNPSSASLGSASASSSSTPLGGFSGATVVRTPQEALEGIKSLTPPVLPQLPIAHAYMYTNGKKEPQIKHMPNHLHSQSNSLDRGNRNKGDNVHPMTGQTIHRSQSATEELRSPISALTSATGPPTPSTAPPCRSGIVGVRGVLKSPSYGYLRSDETANEWAKEVLGSIRISTDHKDSAFSFGAFTHGEGEGEDLTSFIESYRTKHDTLQAVHPGFASHDVNSSTTSVQTFGHGHNLETQSKGCVQPQAQPLPEPVIRQGYTEDQYKPYTQPEPRPSGSSIGSSMMLDEASYPPRSSSTLQHLEEVKFTPIPPTSTYSEVSSSQSRMTATPENEYDDVEYDPFKKISHYPSSSISTLPTSTSTSTATPTPTVKETETPERLIKYTTPTYPQANPVESTYSPLGSKTRRLAGEEEEDRSFMLALPTQDFTRSPSTHSMNPPSPVQNVAAPDQEAESPESLTYNSPLLRQSRSQSKSDLGHGHGRAQGHVRSPSTPTPIPSCSASSAIPRSIQTHHRSPSSPAEFTPSPLSPGPNAPISRFSRRPSLLSDRSTLKTQPHRPPTRISVKPTPTPAAAPRRISVQTPFHATMLQDKVQLLPDPNSPNLILLNLEFAYSLDEKPNNEKVIIPLQILQKQAPNQLVAWIERYLSRSQISDKKVVSTVTTIPEMTDGESAEESDLESDNGLNALLRDEYLNSILMPNSPTLSTAANARTGLAIEHLLSMSGSDSGSAIKVANELDSSNLPPTPASMLNTLDDLPTRVQSPNNQMWKRGVTPRQYEQLQGIYPTPLSSLGPTSQYENDDDEGDNVEVEGPDVGQVSHDESTIGACPDAAALPDGQSNSCGQSNDHEEEEGEEGVEGDESHDKFEEHWIPPKTPPLSIRRHSKSHLPPSTPAPTSISARRTNTPTPFSTKAQTQRDVEEGKGGEAGGFGNEDSTDQGKLREFRIFLTREAGSWHRIAHRLLSGRWGHMSQDIRSRVIEELEWCDMADLKDEIDLEDGSKGSSYPVNGDVRADGGGRINQSPVPPSSTTQSSSTSTSTRGRERQMRPTHKPSMSADFIGFAPLNGSSNSNSNSDITVDDYPNHPISIPNPNANSNSTKKVTRSSSSTSLMMLRSKGSRISGVARGGSGYI